jgi:uncharacterized protein YukJ
MAIPNYSVLRGDPQSGKVVFDSNGANPHYRIYMQDGSQADVNIESQDGSEVLYVIYPNFEPPNAGLLDELQTGITPLDRVAGGLALDYVREKVNGEFMVQRADMSLLPIEAQDPNNPLKNAVVDLLNQAVADPEGAIYAFGSGYSDTNGATGVHNIHMNQGNSGRFSADNGTWSDGGLFISLPASDTWTALFIAFQTESWQTDDNGDPIS